MEAPTVEKAVNDEIAAWQQDQNPLHLLKAIAALQHMLDLTAGMAESASNATMSVVGSARGWTGPASQAGPPGQSSSGSFARIAGSTQGTASPDVIARAADAVRSQVRNTFRNVRRATDRAIEILEGAAAEAAKPGGLQAGNQGPGGFGGRASGAANPASQGAAAAQNPTSHGAGQGGFGGRASGTIRR